MTRRLWLMLNLEPNIQKFYWTNGNWKQNRELGKRMKLGANMTYGAVWCSGCFAAKTPLMHQIDEAHLLSPRNHAHICFTRVFKTKTNDDDYIRPSPILSQWLDFCRYRRKPMPPWGKQPVLKTKKQASKPYPGRPAHAWIPSNDKMHGHVPLQK